MIVSARLLFISYLIQDSLASQLGIDDVFSSQLESSFEFLENNSS